MSTKKMKRFSKKKWKQIHVWLRVVVQLLFFLLFPSAYTAAFAGVKYLLTQLGAGEMIHVTAFLAILIALCGYTMVFGRFFCGFACAFGSLGDWVHTAFLWLCRKLKKKPPQIKSNWMTGCSLVKYGLLAAIGAACFYGVYARAQGTSPWDVFSMLRAGNFHIAGYHWGAVLLVLLLVGMCVQERFFCRIFCPMGAVFALLPVLPAFGLERDRQSCVEGCSACTKSCPSDIELPETGKPEPRGDCFQCQKCIDSCPKNNVHCGITVLKGNEMLLTLARAAVLAGLFLWLGI